MKNRNVYCRGLTPFREIGLSLGSNLGDRLKNLRLAKEKIASIVGVEVVAQSPVYETEPVDVPPEFGDKWFINAVLIIKCDFKLNKLAELVKAIEVEMGRVRCSDSNLPRLIDIDIIYAGQMCIHGNNLTVPHPRWTGRRFVVQPLADVRPQIKIPGENLTVQQILLSLPETPEVVFYTRDW